MPARRGLLFAAALVCVSGTAETPDFGMGLLPDERVKVEDLTAGFDTLAAERIGRLLDRKAAASSSPTDGNPAPLWHGDVASLASQALSADANDPGLQQMLYDADEQVHPHPKLVKLKAISLPTATRNASAETLNAQMPKISAAAKVALTKPSMRAPMAKVRPNTNTRSAVLALRPVLDTDSRPAEETAESGGGAVQKASPKAHVTAAAVETTGAASGIKNSDGAALHAALKSQSPEVTKPASGAASDASQTAVEARSITGSGSSTEQPSSAAQPAAPAAAAPAAPSSVIAPSHVAASASDTGAPASGSGSTAENPGAAKQHEHAKRKRHIKIIDGHAHISFD